MDAFVLVIGTDMVSVYKNRSKAEKEAIEYIEENIDCVPPYIANNILNLIQKTEYENAIIVWRANHENIQIFSTQLIE